MSLSRAISPQVPRRTAESGRISVLPNLRGALKIYLKSLPKRENMFSSPEPEAGLIRGKKKTTKIERTILVQFLFNSSLSPGKPAG